MEYKTHMKGKNHLKMEKKWGRKLNVGFSALCRKFRTDQDLTDNWSEVTCLNCLNKKT